MARLAGCLQQEGYMPIRNALIFFVLTLAGVSSVSPQQPKSSTVSFLLQIVERQTDLSPNGGVTSDCLLVQPDGHFHLERRQQHLPNPSANLTIFSAQLSKTQLEGLRSILDKQDIQSLSPFVPPVLPVSVTKFRVFAANVARGATIQKAGFFMWEGQGTPDTPPNSTPDDIKRAWQTSATVLQPLVDWFHALEGMKLRPSHAKPTLCGLDPDEHN
jgi:hypothetical protein